MAKRKQLEVPSPEALKEMEQGFARETSAPGLRPPIADVVADAAIRSTPLPQADREELARDKADAERLREADGKGLIAREIPIHEITADALTRDRMAMDEDELTELCTSISANGLRLPIEVFEPSNPDTAGKFALISGFRRLAAYRRLNTLTAGEKYQTIPCFIRQPGSIADTLVAMVEENEIRTGLSQYERGRVAAIAVHEGVFATIEDAVKTLFGSASKAKRSKVKSFALVHEELGDMLSHATHLSERQCLRLAAALRAGQGGEIRVALDDHVTDTPEAEWAVLEPLVTKAEGIAPDPSRGGRPRKEAKTREGREVPLANGISIQRIDRADGYAIQFHGANVNSELVDQVMDHIRHLLEKID